MDFMRKIRTDISSTGLLATVLCVSLFTGLAYAQPGPAASGVSPGGAVRTIPAVATDTDQIIVRLNQAAAVSQGMMSATRNGTSSPNAVALSRLSAVAGNNLRFKRGAALGAHVLKLDKKKSIQEVRAIARKLAADSTMVEFAEADVRMFPLAVTPNDEFFAAYQWHYRGAPEHGMNLTEGWEYSTGSPDIVVAVLDTGLHYDHPDLDPNRLLPGYDMLSDLFQANDGDGRDSDPIDPGDWVTAQESAVTGCPVTNSTWHGTHVAGTIGAASNNSVGVTGVDWNAKILPVRVLGKCGGYVSDIGDGILWAAGLPVPGVPQNPNPADVINLSLGGQGNCEQSYYNSVINSAHAAGVTIVAAAGNAAGPTSNVMPANCQNVITVAAHRNDGTLSGYSNYGADVDIMAPGGDNGGFCSGEQVVSLGMLGETSPQAYAYLCYTGTSMAAPHVAGLISLMLSIDPELTPDQLADLVRNNSRPFVAGDRCPGLGCGAGIADAALVLDAVTDQLVPDSDGDGVADDLDAFPNDPTEWEDSDGDGRGDNSDIFPDDPGEWEDSDGDGRGDNSDVFPDDPGEWEDSDGDGRGDNSDVFPDDPGEWEDSDGDGYGDNSDEFPNDSSEWEDSDGDGYGDNSDRFPGDPGEWLDTDGDGVGDNTDAYPFDPNRQEESNDDPEASATGLGPALIKAIIERRQ
jgi:serine protease